MKIKDINSERILFDNGSTITFCYCRVCFENNYADFEQLEESALTYDFDEDLVFDAVDGVGFRFGNEDGMMFFVPCYSEQNGYYSSDVEINYNGKQVIELKCEKVIVY